ncbi:MAG: type II secretion system F family protein [Rhizomicrobium sp.]
MMRILFLLMTVVAALRVVLPVYRARAAMLRRLQALVDHGAEEKSGAREGRNLARFLPSILLRDLRLLDVEPTLPRFLGFAASLMLLVLAMGALFGWASALGCAALVVLASSMTVNLLASRRLTELGEHLPGFFDRVRQLLIIGNSLPTAFARAVQGAQPRLVAFFTPTLRRIGHGAGFSETIRQSAEDIGLYEMRLFAAAVAANMRFGGSLTHSLGNLVGFLRKRAAIERELRANTAQIRFSAWVLGALPLLVAALIVAQNPDYARWFLTDELGRSLLAYCVISEILGALVMRAIIRTEF